MKKYIILSLFLLSLSLKAQSIGNLPVITNPPVNYVVMVVNPGNANYQMSISALEAVMQSALSFAPSTFPATVTNTFATIYNLLVANTNIANLQSFQTNTTNVFMPLGYTNTFAPSNFPSLASNIFAPLSSGFFTNRSTVYADTTNFGIGNSNFMFIAAITNNQGKLYVSSNGTWISK